MVVEVNEGRFHERNLFVIRRGRRGGPAGGAILSYSHSIVPGGLVVTS